MLLFLLFFSHRIGLIISQSIPFFFCFGRQKLLVHVSWMSLYGLNMEHTMKLEYTVSLVCCSRKLYTMKEEKTSEWQIHVNVCLRRNSFILMFKAKGRLIMQKSSHQASTEVEFSVSMTYIKFIYRCIRMCLCACIYCTFLAEFSK